VASPEAPRVTTIQVGLGWQPSRAGGLNRMFHELARRLPAEGVQVHGLVAGGPQVAVESGGTVRAFAPDSASMWTRVRASRRAVRELTAAHPNAVLVSHFAPYGLSLLGSVGRHPLVVHFHGPWYDESRAQGRGALSALFRKAIERRVYRRARVCIVLSRAFGTLLQEEFDVAPERIRVIPGGVDAARFADLPTRADARRALGWDPEARTVLAVRRLVRRTGIDRLIEAVPKLRARVPGIRIVIAGDGPERAACEERIRALGAEADVRLLGFLPEEQLPFAYRAADLTIVPSVALEGFGLVVPESLAAGTPVLVTPVGGLPETVEALSGDLVLRDSTPDAIADGISEAFDGRRALPDAATCAAFARARYDWSVVAREVADVLASVA
jgi:glycosyltransferase involved in cell wall biosynthesis